LRDHVAAYALQHLVDLRQWGIDEDGIAAVRQMGHWAQFHGDLGGNAFDLVYLLLAHVLETPILIYRKGELALLSEPGNWQPQQRDGQWPDVAGSVLRLVRNGSHYDRAVPRVAGVSPAALASDDVGLGAADVNPDGEPSSSLVSVEQIEAHLKRLQTFLERDDQPLRLAPFASLVEALHARAFGAVFRVGFLGESNIGKSFLLNALLFSMGHDPFEYGQPQTQGRRSAVVSCSANSLHGRTCGSGAHTESGFTPHRTHTQ
jgi:hypothetical protein